VSLNVLTGGYVNKKLEEIKILKNFFLVEWDSPDIIRAFLIRDKIFLTIMNLKLFK